MAPKKRSITQVGPSASNPHVPIQEGVDAAAGVGGSGEQELPPPPANQNQTGDANAGYGRCSELQEWRDAFQNAHASSHAATIIGHAR
jgi:hypothetical protein